MTFDQILGPRYIPLSSVIRLSLVRPKWKDIAAESLYSSTLTILPLQNMAPSTRKTQHMADIESGLALRKMNKPTPEADLGKTSCKEGEEDYNQLPFEEAKASKKRKITMQRAKAEIENHIEDVLAFIEERQGAMCPDFDNGRCQKLSADFESVLKHPEMHTSLSKQFNSHNPMFQKAKDTLVQFKIMVNKYREPDKCERAITMPTWARWAQDKKDLEALDEHAILIAARLISSLIVPNPNQSMKIFPDTEDEIARMAWEFFPEKTPHMAQHTWGRIAQEQVKAFTHVLRSTEKK